MAALACQGVALANAAFDFGDQCVVVEGFDLRGPDGFAPADVDHAGARQRALPGPGVESAVEGHWHQRHRGAAGNGAEAGLHGVNFAIGRASAFREEQHHFAALDALERFLQSAQTAAIAVDGNGVQGPNHQPK